MNLQTHSVVLLTIAFVVVAILANLLALFYYRVIERKKALDKMLKPWGLDHRGGSITAVICQSLRKLLGTNSSFKLQCLFTTEASSNHLRKTTNLK
jgi:branched-subunit amino acid ABC-type transport system permease component